MTTEYIEMLIGMTAQKTLDQLKNLEGAKAVMRMAANSKEKETMKKPAGIVERLRAKDVVVVYIYIYIYIIMEVF